MLDAVSAAIVAFFDKANGTLFHYECLPSALREDAYAYARSTGIDWDFYEYLDKEHDLRPVSRYEVHEMMAESRYDVETHPDSYSDTLAEGLARRDALDLALAVTVWDDRFEPLKGMRDDLDQQVESLLDALVAVSCDECLGAIG
jgi:hypothetical protein